MGQKLGLQRYKLMNWMVQSEYSIPTQIQPKKRGEMERGEMIDR